MTEIQAEQAKAFKQKWHSGLRLFDHVAHQSSQLERKKHTTLEECHGWIFHLPNLDNLNAVGHTIDR